MIWRLSDGSYNQGGSSICLYTADSEALSAGVVQDQHEVVHSVLMTFPRNNLDKIILEILIFSD